MRSILAGFAVCLAAFAGMSIWPRPVHAQKAFLNVARELYGFDERFGKCLVCHEARRGPSRRTLNEFGKALQGLESMKPALGKNSSYTFHAQELAAVAKALQELDAKDTDADGATNREELLLKTAPADAGEKPEAAALEALRERLKRAAEQGK